MTVLPPYLKGEVSSRIIAVTPEMRQCFNLDAVTFSGEDIESLLAGVWLMGYGEGVKDGADGMTGEMPSLLAWVLENMGAAT